jgi:hypothetical protein
LFALSQKCPELERFILDDIQPYSADDGASPLGDILWRVITAETLTNTA